MKTENLFIKTNESTYPIYIGQNLLRNSELVRRHVRSHQIMIVSNETIAPHYLNLLKSSYSDFQCDTFILPDGEQFKNIQYWQLLLNKLALSKHHRDTTLVALGGGVIGDITGFAAACYQRGVNFIQIPTTLLAQVDASIGGKTAINHPAGKNLIGAFHQPTAVIIDTTTLNTLPDREFKSGFSEIIKIALIKDENFFYELEKNLPQLLLNRSSSLLQYIIKRACEIKRDLIITDEKEEKDQRILLNLGHTFAHAIEHLLNYRQWLHGEAVSVGIVLAAELSRHQELLDSNSVKRIRVLLSQIPLPIELPQEIDTEALLLIMKMDKKVYNKSPRFILLNRIGHALVSNQITNNKLRSVISAKHLNLDRVK